MRWLTSERHCDLFGAHTVSCSSLFGSIAYGAAGVGDLVDTMDA